MSIVENIHSRRAITRAWLTTPVDERDPHEDLVDCAVIALGTDRLAARDDILPVADDTDRRGWWGDLDAEDVRGGWAIGSRLWLLARAKITGADAAQGSTLARAEDYTDECLRPFVTAGVASHLVVTGARTVVSAITIQATLYRGDLDAIELRFSDLWNGTKS